MRIKAKEFVKKSQWQQRSARAMSHNYALIFKSAERNRQTHEEEFSLHYAHICYNHWVQQNTRTDNYHNENDATMTNVERTQPASTQAVSRDFVFIIPSNQFKFIGVKFQLMQ